MFTRAAAILLATLVHPLSARAQETPWDTVGGILGTTDAFSGGYHRYNFPRRELTLRIGDVRVSPALARGAWAGFSGTPADATMMGDLVLTGAEVRPVLAELARQQLEVTALHNHLLGEEPRLIYLHYHGQGSAEELARRLDRVLAVTGVPRPVAAATAAPLQIDTAAVFAALGHSGKAQGNVAQVGFVLVPGQVMMDGRPVVPGLGYGSPINIQMVDGTRAVATGDFAVLGARVGPLLEALTAHDIGVTAVHSHMVGETPAVYFVHFWADGALSDVLRGLRAALDSAR